MNDMDPRRNWAPGIQLLAKLTGIAIVAMIVRAAFNWLERGMIVAIGDLWPIGALFFFLFLLWTAERRLQRIPVPDL